MKRTFLILFSIIIIIFVVMCLPVFSVDAIVVEGNVKVSDEYVQNTVGMNKNIFTYSTRKLEEELMTNPYVESAEITKEFPSTISVMINERKHICYVQNTDNSYIYLDEHGYVLEISEQMVDTKPLIVGLEFSNATVGEQLSVEDPLVFDTISMFADLINDYGMSSYSITIDVTDMEHIVMQIYDIEILLGTTEDINDKLNIVSQFLFQVPNVESLKGTLDVSNTEVDPVFSIYIN